MSGREAGRRSRRSRGTSAGIAAALLSLLIIVYLSGVWPNTMPAELSLALPPPGQLWILLMFLVAQTVVGYLYFRERGRLKRALARGPFAIEGPEPELRPHGPMAGGEPRPEPDVEVSEVGASAPVGVPAAGTKRDGEFSKLLQWLDDVSTQISGWGNGTTGSLDSPIHPQDGSASAPLVLGDEKPRGTSRIPVPKLGAWTEVRARSAIEKYLRKRPWAPAAHIAKELGMDLHLASRVASTLREESVR